MRRASLDIVYQIRGLTTSDLSRSLQTWTAAAPSAPAQILSYTTPVLIYIADPISNEPLISLNNLDLPQFHSRWSTYKVREQTDAIKIPMGWRTFSKSFRYSNVSRWIVKSSLMFIDDAFTDLYYGWDLIWDFFLQQIWVFIGIFLLYNTYIKIDLSIGILESIKICHTF